MNISLAWLCDHLILPDGRRCTPVDIDRERLIELFGATTAEIESVYEVRLEQDRMMMAQIEAVSGERCVLKNVEGLLRHRIELPIRSDVAAGDYVLLYEERDGYRYATNRDFGSEKEGFFPPLFCEDPASWRTQCELSDTIIKIDNKAITHRPDLWGHRGVAREVAALFGFSLMPDERVYAHLPILHYTAQAGADAGNSLGVSIKSPVCKRLAVYELTVEDLPRGSWLFMAARLARVDLRPLRLLIDITNYVMFDIGHPMHAFDRSKITGDLLIARAGTAGEALKMLDDDKIVLSGGECVLVTQDSIPLALAGVMGGASTAIDATTTRVVFEAGLFDATAVRIAAMVHKKRTEAAMRFEKSLDPQGNTQAIARAVALLIGAGVKYQGAQALLSVGPLPVQTEIELDHSWLESMLGIMVNHERVIDLLRALGFGITRDAVRDSYRVTVPSFRATKDVQLPQDLLEEVARFIGYHHIPVQVPVREMRPFNLRPVLLRRQIKELCAFGIGMREVQNYAFYDEEWIVQLGLEVWGAVLANPVSNQWRRLVASLIPHLLKAVVLNKQAERIGFFELNAVWQRQAADGALAEQQMCAGLLYDYRRSFDFYAGKAELQKLFDQLELTVFWRSASSLPAWVHRYQGAELVLSDGVVIGYAGIIAPKILQAMGCQGGGFVWEFDLAPIGRERSGYTWSATAKYPAVAHDISCFVPRVVTVDMVHEVLARADYRIVQVELIDFVDRVPADSGDRHAMTLRYTFVDDSKTMDRAEIEAVDSAVARALIQVGCVIR